MQSNELYGNFLVKKFQKSDDQLQEFKETREVSTKLTEQPQSDEQLELKKNEAYVSCQLPTVDNVAYGQIQNLIVWLDLYYT